MRWNGKAVGGPPDHNSARRERDREASMAVVKNGASNCSHQIYRLGNRRGFSNCKSESFGAAALRYGTGTHIKHAERNVPTHEIGLGVTHKRYGKQARVAKGVASRETHRICHGETRK